MLLHIYEGAGLQGPRGWFSPGLIGEKRRLIDIYELPYMQSSASPSSLQFPLIEPDEVEDRGDLEILSDIKLYEVITRIYPAIP